MSVLSPKSRVEVARASWLIPLLVFTPLVLVHIVLRWRIYFNPDANVEAFFIAGALSIPAVFLLFRRASKLVSLGLHPYFYKGMPIKARQYFVTWLGMVFVLYLWTLAAFAVTIPIGSVKGERQYSVFRAMDCSYKCLGCEHTVTFEEWLGDAASPLCADHLKPRAKIGERLLMRGYWSSRAIYVQELLRADGS